MPIKKFKRLKIDNTPLSVVPLELKCDICHEKIVHKLCTYCKRSLCISCYPEKVCKCGDLFCNTPRYYENHCNDCTLFAYRYKHIHNTAKNMSTDPVTCQKLRDVMVSLCDTKGRREFVEANIW